VLEPRLRDHRHDVLADSSRTQASSAQVTCRQSNPCWSAADAEAFDARTDGEHGAGCRGTERLLLQ
jgi:hypothetical protein